VSRLSFVQWLRFAIEDVGRALRFVVRPWVDLRAVKTNQIDIINAVSAHQADFADVLASIRTFSQDLARLDARVTEQDANIRRLLDSIESVRRELLRQGGDRPTSGP
jgi:hypothetical protein